MSEEVNKFLEKLGLTEYEAKTLSALFGLKDAEAPEISRAAQVPKTRVYDVLDRLTKKELIIEIHGRPKRYMAIEPEKVFESLISDMRKNLKDIESEAENLKNSITTTQGTSEHEKVMKVKDRNDFMKILGQEIDSAQKSVTAITPINAEHSVIRENIRNASARNVEVKLISSINESGKNIAQEFTKTGAEIRELKHGMNAYIIDGKKVILALSDFNKNRPEYHFTIWQDNAHMADALMKYFDYAWQEAGNK